MPASTPASSRAQETLELKYMRQTRTATVFIAVVVGIFTALAVAGTIYTASVANKLNSLNGVTNSNCVSQGGTIPNC